MTSPMHEYGNLNQIELDIDFKKLEDSEVNPLFDIWENQFLKKVETIIRELVAEQTHSSQNYYSLQRNQARVMQILL